MKRIKGFEWEDQPWFPSFLRQYMTDFLRFILGVGNLYQPVTPILIEGLQQTNSRKIVDLCSGAGGAIQSVQKNIGKATGETIDFIVTDLYPNVRAYRQLQKETNGSITYSAELVNATDVPSSLKGFRTIFSGFHHFDESTAQQVLQNAVDTGEGIAILMAAAAASGLFSSLLFFILLLLFCLRLLSNHSLYSDCCLLTCCPWFRSVQYGMVSCQCFVFIRRMSCCGYQKKWRIIKVTDGSRAL